MSVDSGQQAYRGYRECLISASPAPGEKIRVQMENVNFILLK